MEIDTRLQSNLFDHNRFGDIIDITIYNRIAATIGPSLFNIEMSTIVCLNYTNTSCSKLCLVFLVLHYLLGIQKMYQT